jgi:hypothetical protein
MNAFADRRALLLSAITAGAAATVAVIPAMAAPARRTPSSPSWRPTARPGPASRNRTARRPRSIHRGSGRSGRGARGDHVDPADYRRRDARRHGVSGRPRWTRGLSAEAAALVDPAVEGAGGMSGSCGVQTSFGKVVWGRSTGTIPMIKSLVVAAALTIGLAGYAFAQDTVTGAPAGTAPMTPAPGTHPPVPGMTGSHKSQMRHRSSMSKERARASAHHMHHMRAKPAATPAT